MQVVCPKCKIANSRTSKFCRNCGASLEFAQMVQEVPKLTERARPSKPRGWLLAIILGVVFLGCVACVIFGLTILSTPTYETTTTPTMTTEELKAAAEQIPYDELARNTGNHIGEFVYYRGKVVQVVEGFGQQMGLRVEVTEGEYGFWDDLVWVNYKGPRLLEDDIINFWGKVEGRYSYETVLGATVTIPEITAVVLSLEK